MTGIGTVSLGRRRIWTGSKERKVSECLSGTFVCVGGCGMQCGVQ